MNLGYPAVVAAYILWGIFPFYWKQLSHVDAIEVIGHRIVWSFIALTVGMYFWMSQSSSQWRRLFSKPSDAWWSLTAALLIGTNWFVFIYSVQHDMVVESALGYFITPLMSVALGVVLLGERMPVIQWLAVAFAAAGVGYITYKLGRVPYLALILASSFAIYGIVKKRMQLKAVPGLWLETGILLLPALGLLAWYFSREINSFAAFDRKTDMLIVFGGPTTAIPLLLFSFGAQRIPLSQLGLLQYIAPSIQFLVGWLAFAEPVNADRWIGFSLVWIGLAIFAASSVVIRLRVESTRDQEPGGVST
jgi:chloramphenicol-sensitive protein RarD